eukprot:6955046-Pyramimonas_sp.AAC.1
MGEGGALGDGLSVNIMGASEAEMSKFLAEAPKLEGAKVSRAKPREAPEKHDTDGQQAATDPVEGLKEKMPKVHDQATKARALGNSLRHHEYGKDLSESMIKHADKMDELYGEAAQRVKSGTLQSASRYAYQPLA